MALFVISNNYLAPAPKQNEPDNQVLQRIPTEKGKQNYIAVMKRVNKANLIFRKNGNLIAMIAIPFISIFTFIFFRRRGFNYIEHLVANMMFVAFSNLIFTLIIFPVEFLLNDPKLSFKITLLAFVFQGIYFGWALNGFLLLKSPGDRLKSFAVSFISILLWAIFSILIMGLYIYQSKDFYKIFTRMSG